MLKIKKNDMVIVTCGRDKGKKGEVSKILKKNYKGKIIIKVLIDGINLIKKHVKANPNKNIAGGIVDKEMYIDYSNISIFNINKKIKDKIKIVYTDNIKKRIYKSDGDIIKNV